MKRGKTSPCKQTKLNFLAFGTFCTPVCRKWQLIENSFKLNVAMCSAEFKGENNEDFMMNTSLLVVVGIPDFLLLGKL